MSNDETNSSVESERVDEEVTESESPPKRSLLSKLRIGAMLLAGALLLVVAARNWEPVTIDLVGQKIKVALSVLVILTFLCGTVIGLLLAFFRPWRKQG